MNGAAVTFDFHQTLAHCERWFDLEVRDLAAEFLVWQATHRGIPLTPGLTSAARLAYRQLRQEIIRHGHELPAERCVAVVLDQLGRPAPSAKIAAGVEELMRAAFIEVQAVPGAIGTVQALAEAGIPLGVVSSAVYHPFLAWSLSQFGLADAFPVVTTSASVGYYKSRPEIYTLTLTALGATADRSVHIGDSFRWDVEGARRAGMRTVWVRRTESEPASSAPPDLTLSDLVGAAPAILELLAASGDLSGERPSGTRRPSVARA